MFNYISSYNNKIFLVENEKIHVLQDKKVLKTIKHNSTFTYLFRNIAIDSDKNLYLINETNLDNSINVSEDLKLCFKIKKSISSITYFSDSYFLADRFGDVYKISKDFKLEYLFGTMCYPIGIEVVNNEILILDKYGRIRSTSIDGKIINYFKFFEILPSAFTIFDNKIYLGSKQKLIRENEYIENKGDCFLMNVNKFIKNYKKMIILTNNKIETNHSFDVLNGKDGIFLDENFIYINNDNNLVWNDQKIMELEMDYKNFTENIER